MKKFNGTDPHEERWRRRRSLGGFFEKKVFQLPFFRLGMNLQVVSPPLREVWLAWLPVCRPHISGSGHNTLSSPSSKGWEIRD